MPRIVKKDAIPSGPQDAFYHQNQLIEIKKGWRPQDHKNPTPAVILPANVDNPYGEDALHEAFEAGFDACIEAMEKL
jgi:hypothetical protein